MAGLRRTIACATACPAGSPCGPCGPAAPCGPAGPRDPAVPIKGRKNSQRSPAQHLEIQELPLVLQQGTALAQPVPACELPAKAISVPRVCATATQLSRQAYQGVQGALRCLQGRVGRQGLYSQQTAAANQAAGMMGCLCCCAQRGELLMPGVMPQCLVCFAAIK